MSPRAPRAASTVAGVPVWLRGLWRRRSIEWPDGTVDDTTLVYWLQTESAFADIRIPADRPDLRARGGFAALTDDEIAQLARQGGFAGWTELDGERCAWHRQIDFQPPAGLPDEGRLHWRDGVLVEEGVHESYVELWERVAVGSGALSVARAEDEILVTCGDAFVFARARPAPLPGAASLATLLAAAGSLREVEQLLDCEISYGLCRGGRMPWEIRLSTLPWREGEALVPAAVSGGIG